MRTVQVLTMDVLWVIVPAGARRNPGILPHGTKIIEMPAGSEQDKILQGGGTTEIGGQSWQALDTWCRYEKQERIG